MEQEFLDIINPVIKNKEFLKLKNLKHHNSTRFNHCLLVAYYNYKVYKKFGKLLKLDMKTIVLVGLYHDLFFYDQYKCPKGKIHAYYHAEEALKNAERIFDLTDIEKDAILKHMFPICKGFPKYKETWIIVITDKYSAIVEKCFNKNLETCLNY